MDGVGDFSSFCVIVFEAGGAQGVVSLLSDSDGCADTLGLGNILFVCGAVSSAVQIVLWIGMLVSFYFVVVVLFAIVVFLCHCASFLVLFAAKSDATKPLAFNSNIEVFLPPGNFIEFGIFCLVSRSAMISTSFPTQICCSRTAMLKMSVASTKL